MRHTSGISRKCLRTGMNDQIIRSSLLAGWTLRRGKPVLYSSTASSIELCVCCNVTILHAHTYVHTYVLCIASSADDGRLELWDLQHSTLDPVVRVFITDEAAGSAAAGAGKAVPQTGKQMHVKHMRM